MKDTNKTQTRFSFFILLLLGALAVTTIIGCSKEDVIELIIQDTFIPPSALEFSNLRASALARHTETAIFNAEEGISFTSNDGAVLNISANCLTLGGYSATGEVELTFIDIYDRQHMAPTNKPTMGFKPNGDKAMLITGGEFFIEVRKDGVLLESGCSFQLIVPGDNTGGVDPEMILWNGIIDENGDLTWDPILDGQGHERIFVENDSYFVFAHNFGWTNIDKFYSDTRPKTAMRVRVPEGLNYANSAMYLSYDGEENALAQLDKFDPETNLFTEHYGQIPIGIDVHLIFITAEGEDYRYGIQSVRIAENEIYEINLEDTQVGSYENWESTIESLP